MQFTNALFDYFDLTPEHCFQPQHVKVPGKLFVAGEYAVLEPGQPAILFAVDQYLVCQIDLSTALNSGLIQSNLPDLQDLQYIRQANTPFLTQYPNNAWRYVLAAMDVIEHLLVELDRPIQDYRLQFISQLISDEGVKYGFGSSGAVTVGTIRALLQFYGLVPRQPLVIYQLAAIAMLSLSSTGSLADIAVNSFGGWIFYQSLDRDWLHHRLSQPYSISDLLRCHWPKLKIESLTAPHDLVTLVGWTGSPASTDDMIQLLKTHAIVQDAYYVSFLKSAAEIVIRLRQSFESEDSLAIQSGVADYRHLLLQLSKHYQLSIETTELTTLVTTAQAYQFEAKSSGAGGGDCGIAVGQLTSNIAQLKSAWEQAHITPLNVGVAPAT